jgi:hypothetical protein
MDGGCSPCTHDAASSPGVWPQLLEFFYTDEIVLDDDNVLPLLAMARQLMVKSIEV